MADLQGRRIFKVFGSQDFIVDERYQVTKELGQGAYGIVWCVRFIAAPHREPQLPRHLWAGKQPNAIRWLIDVLFLSSAAVNSQTDEGVAIKKVTNVFSKKILAKRALREIKLLQHFRGHRNITCLYDMDIPRPDNFNETYLYEELMECDLAAIIRSGQPLTDAHFQSFIYQILCGLKYIHSANVLHRDLKPGNLLVNADCELKICDFGLARGFSINPDENAGYMTEYVATRWYRAPEIMLSFQSYTKAIDVWSVGCILAELLGGRPFFKGRDYVDQLNQILHILGTPNEDTLSRIGSSRAQEYVRNLPYMAKKPFPSLFTNANPDALDLLDRMLAFDPSSRISVETALQHPYLKIWHDETDEPDCPTQFNFDFEVVDEVSEMRKMILNEVYQFRQMVRTAPGGGANNLGASAQAGQVPLPSSDSQQQWRSQDPKPQDFEQQDYAQMDGLERELQHGLDRR
ncbi:kinase-like domain-containing protein [Pseudomassariella vexata]|uniref:Mitogen-activated protein kinase n=1 Tax=Pseudomassariella vexata TaxID=1141098 RepID=A0A1Y2ECX2_9PEZI|nr:kinase-like domain-containing protein [Pseudomassariella vexata]ORY69106.1 kinase-like domain-containing protein [Pseudomassariella vexata]